MTEKRPMKAEPPREPPPKAQQDIDAVKAALLERGFLQREYPESDLHHRKLLLWRQLKDVTPVCQDNEKLWFMLTITWMKRSDADNRSILCEFDITGENVKGEWAELRLYSIPIFKVVEKLNDAEHRLVEAWRAVNA